MANMERREEKAGARSFEEMGEIQPQKLNLG